MGTQDSPSAPPDVAQVRPTATDGGSDATGSFDLSSGNGDAGSGQPDAGGVTDAAADQAAPDVLDVMVSDGSMPDAADAQPLPEAATAPTCTTDLSNIGTSEFRIAFTITATTVNNVALLNQRTFCTTGTFWDLRYKASVGQIDFELDDGAGHDVEGTANAILNNGVPHQVVLSRAEDTVTVEVDGADAGTTDGGQALLLLGFGGLAPLKIGSDVCDGIDGTAPLGVGGTISDVCLSH